MAELHADFRSDLLTIARQQLATEWGEEAQQISDEEVLTSFFDSSRRRPAVRPRTLSIADDFQCPPDYGDSWKALRKKIAEGGDLRPHLSRRHASLDALDGLLNEWGVHHLHLGTALADNSGHVERSGPLLFARITDKDFYAINIYPHGAWENSSVLESLHRNWPDSIKNYRINGIHGEPLTQTQRRNLRRSNIQTATATADGTVYMSIGGGVASSGASTEAVMSADMLWSDVEQLQIAVQGQLEKFLPHLRVGGYADRTEVRASLMAITSKAFQVAFPDYGVLANVTLEGGWFHRRWPS